MNRAGITCRRAAVAALLFLSNNPIFSDTFDVRALWVVRDHIITADKIDDVLEFADINNYNHLFVQIRGRGDAYYTSRVVPRSHLLVGTDFDPLAYIIKKARHYNIAIHAWINVYYLWSSQVLPSQQDHLLYTHNSWLDTEFPDPINVEQTMEAVKLNKNANGEGFYLAPTHPEVDAHLQMVITELVQNYKLDGIHFDYIRYHAKGWGLNPVGMKLFFNQSFSIPGLPALEVKEKPTFNDYKRDAITKFIRKASTRIKAYQPYCTVSAAVKPNLNDARDQFGQEWDVWLSGRYIDWAVPMNYAMDLNNFDRNIQIMKNNLPIQYLDRIIMGIAVYNQKPRIAGQKIYHAGKNEFGGISIFSYTVFKEQPFYAKKLVKYLK